MKKPILLFVLVVLAAAGFVVWKITQPSSSFRTATIEFPRGTSTRQMAEQLTAAGVIDRPEWFLLARALRSKATLQAGEYHFETPQSPLTVLDKIARGEVLLHSIVVPEGSNIFDVARIVEEFGFGRSDAFLSLVKNDEGRLFPATYRFAKGTSASQIAGTMRSRFQAAWTELSPASADQRQIVTLASLVEKEAKVAEERPLIAGVYWNRVRKDMRMDCDPTVIYAALLDGKYRGTIYQSDLDRESPYNTYKRTGLPPGPIANPGLESLRAALRPAKTDYLFFVALPDGSGRHFFSKTIGEHNRAVLEYRRGQGTKTQSTNPVPRRKDKTS